MPDFARYVHEWKDDKDQTWYTVAHWSEKNAQYTAPLDAEERRLTGCSFHFARRIQDMPNRYADRDAALRRARHLYR